MHIAVCTCRPNEERSERATRLVEETEALSVSCVDMRGEEAHHVVVRLLLLLNLLLGGGGVVATGGSATSSGSAASDGGTATTDVGEELLDVLALEGLGEETGPDGLDLDTGGGGKSGDLVAGDLNTLVGELGLAKVLGRIRPDSYSSKADLRNSRLRATQSARESARTHVKSKSNVR